MVSCGPELHYNSCMFPKRLKTRALTALTLALTGICSPAPAPAQSLPQDTHKAVILAYMGIGDDTRPEASLSTEQFTAHIAEIERGHYTVLPVPEILQKLASGEDLPPRTLGITFEGASASALQNAVPLLLKNNLPFTVFYASDQIDANTPDVMSWTDLKKLAAHKTVTIGVLPANYAHLSHKDDTQILAELNKARQRYREEFGREADYLSYPYGEYSATLMDRAKTQGFKAAFSLRSGAVYSGIDLYALPRFTMTERYGNLDRFHLIANALPLPISDLEPADPYLKDKELAVGFTLPEALKDSALSCFLSGQPKPDLQKIGRRIELRPTTGTLGISRMRLNCTMAGPSYEDENGQTSEQWRWLGMIFHRDGGENFDDENAAENMGTPSEVTGLPPDELPAPQE